MTDKRVLASERDKSGACPDCGRRHIHTDDCQTLKRREDLKPRSLIKSSSWDYRDRRIESGL